MPGFVLKTLRRINILLNAGVLFPTWNIRYNVNDMWIFRTKRNDTMDATGRMKCIVCGHIYDPKKGDEGVSPGTPFAEIPHEWRCPVCAADKDKFSEMK